MTKILSLDGGGIRGIITAVWLDELQKKLKKGPIGNQFDFIAGTSTGSLLAASLSLGLNPKEIINLYQTKGDDIFPDRLQKLWSRLGRTFTQGASAPKYSDEGLQKVLKDVFGSKKMGDLPIKTMIISYDTVKREPIVFKSWKDEHKNLLIWEVCKSSCSAPTYFPAHELMVESSNRALIDGGVVANNPAACVLAEAIRLNNENPSKEKNFLNQIVLASFGTGQLTRQISVEEAKEWGALEWAIPIIDVLFDGSTDSVDYIVKNLLPSTNYYRFQVELKKGMDDMDDATITNLDVLERLAKSHLSSNEGSKLMETLISKLS